LAPVIIQQIGHTIRTLKEQGFTILLVEQNFRFASDGCGPLLRHGNMAASSTGSPIQNWTRTSKSFTTTLGV
jgi:ABC-type branched-subunit amino acid transport system ATPase component